MARTKAEVRAFLDSVVGTIVVNKGNPDYNGQCVTLTKALLEFLGIPNPYAARGDAINAGDTYIRQGIGVPGRGWLTVVVNRDMGYIGGVHYGHIWVDLQGEANYESNGNRALYTTKNTRPLSQGQQFLNLDQWITEGGDMISPADVDVLRIAHSEIGGWDLHKTHAGEYDKIFLDAWNGQPMGTMIRAQWVNGAGFRNAREAQAQAIRDLQAALGGSKQEVINAQKAVDEANKQLKIETEKATEAGKKLLALEAEKKADQETGNAFLRWLGNILRGGK